MKLTAAYYRSSTKLQEDSVSTQQYDISRYALNKGIFIDVEYPEPYTSARKNSLRERPKMNQLLTDIRKNKIGTLLVYKRDRLARKVDEHIELYQLFKKHNVEVHFIAENEPPMRFDVFGELTELFIAVMNQREGEQITSRIIDTRMNNFLKGKSIGNLPYGYYKNEAKEAIEKNEEELDKVKLIFEKWNTEEYKNYQELATELNNTGLLRNGKEWVSGNVNDILNNPIYMGVRVAKFGEKEAAVSVEDLAVIDKEVFLKAQRIMEERKKPRKKQKKYQYLLAELINCMKCKQELKQQEKVELEAIEKVNSKLIQHERTKRGEKYATYECKKHQVIYSKEEIEVHVFQKTKEFFARLLDTNFKELYELHLKKELKQISTQEKYLNRNLESAEQELVNATSKWISKDTEQRKEDCLKKAAAVKEWKRKLHELESKRYQFMEVPNFVDAIKENFMNQKNWKRLKFENKRDLLDDLIHEVNVDDISIQIVFKHPYLESNEVNI